MNMIDDNKRLSFSGLFKFVDYYIDEYRKEPSFQILYTLCNFYEIALTSKRLKSQRAYCKNAIYALNKEYAEGYFKRKNFRKTKQ